MSGPEQNELTRLAAEAIAALKERGLKISTAEATTGGLIGHLLTTVPGSSSVFRGGMAPYSNDAKQKLGVSKELLDEFGAVSPETAEAMARVIREWVWADVGVAETGVAGPTGASEGRPVGIFWIAVVTPGQVLCERVDFPEDREGNLRSCARMALQMVLKALE